MKLNEALLAREESKLKLLELRRQMTDKRQLVEKLAHELSEDAALLKREHARLVDLTSLAAKLLHSDLAGVTGSADKACAFASDSESSSEEAHA
jgi:hypothetical protein